jgi:hypothetical protein
VDHTFLPMHRQFLTGTAFFFMQVSEPVVGKP